MGQGVRTGLGHGGITCVLQTQFSSFILIPISIKVLLILHTKFQPNIPSHFGDMDLNAWVDVNFFRVDINFQTATAT